jgi:hypothetical protein
MSWTLAHTKTAAAGIVSLFGAVLLFRPPSLEVGLLTIALVTISVLVTDRLWNRTTTRG